jgi:hypothetical protein
MHRVGFIVPHSFQMMSVAALTAFEVANMPPAGPRYDIRVLSRHGGPRQVIWRNDAADRRVWRSCLRYHHRGVDHRDGHARLR